MKNNTRILLTTALVLPLMFWMTPVSQTTKSFKMTIAGTSTLHKWESSVVTGNVKSDILVNEAGLVAINSLSVEVEAGQVKSTHGAGMDKKTWESLKTKQFPKITYLLTKIESITRNGAAQNPKP